LTTHLSTLRDYVRLVFRWKIVLIIPVVVSLLLAVPVVATMNPRYKAYAIVRREDNLLARSAGSSLVAPGARAFSLKSLRVEVLTFSNLKKVIKELNLRPDLETDEQLFPVYIDLTKRISIGLEASTGGSSGMQHIRISGSFDSPELARDIVNTIARNYRDESRKRAQDQAKRAVEFNEGNEQKYKKDLLAKEEQIARYKDKYFVTLPEVKSGILAQQVRLETQLSTHNLLFAQAGTRLREIEKQLQSEPKTVSEITSSENPAVLELEQQLAVLRKALESMLEYCTDDLPEVQSLRKRIASTEKQIEETPERISGTETVRANPVYQGLLTDRHTTQQSVKQHEEAIKQTKASILALNEQKQKVAEEESTYNELMREKTELEEKYAAWRRNLTRVRGRLATEEDETATTVTIVQQAVRPGRQDTAHRLKMVFVFIGAGFGIGLSLMFGLDFSDQSLRSVDDATAFFHGEVPVLGSICQIVSEEEIRVVKRRAWAIDVVAALVVVICAACLAYLVFIQPLVG